MRLNYEFSLCSILDEEHAEERVTTGARYTAFSPFPEYQALVFSLIEGVTSGVTSQIGTKISVDAITRKLCASKSPRLELRKGETIAPILVQAAFQEANKELHRYGQKMLASARISATGIVMCYDGERFSVGRTGAYEAFLYRAGELLRFFEGWDGAERAPERMIGANRQILVDLASVRVQERDRIVLTSFLVPNAKERELAKILTESALRELPDRIRVLKPQGGEESGGHRLVVALDILPTAVSLRNIAD